MLTNRIAWIFLSERALVGDRSNLVNGLLPSSTQTFVCPSAVGCAHQESVSTATNERGKTDHQPSQKSSSARNAPPSSSLPCISCFFVVCVCFLFLFFSFQWIWPVLFVYQQLAESHDKHHADFTERSSHRIVLLFLLLTLWVAQIISFIIPGCYCYALDVCS